MLRAVEEQPDPILEALDALVDAGRHNVTEWMALMQRVEQIRSARRNGVAYPEMLLAGTSVIDAITLNQARLAGAAARFRRVAAQELKAAGVPPAAIAKVFGVTRQRIAALLADTPDVAD